jgi:hypothetical protein
LNQGVRPERHGEAAEVAEAIATRLREQGVKIDVCAAGTVDSLDGYDAVVFGGAFDRTGLRFSDANPATKKLSLSDLRDWEAIEAWAFRQQGYAREASVALMRWARRAHDVRSFVMS